MEKEHLMLGKEKLQAGRHFQYEFGKSCRRVEASMHEDSSAAYTAKCWLELVHEPWAYFKLDDLT